MLRRVWTLAFRILPLVLSPALAGSGLVSPGQASGPADPARGRPNILFILTDDLDAHSIEYMPAVKALLADQGTTFSSFFVTDSLCCPSRASILRGQYIHNHRVQGNHQVEGNAEPFGGFAAFYALGLEDSTIGTWLQAGGYRTGLIGKYLNAYPVTATQTHVPPGWDEWVSPVDNTGYNGYQYILNEQAKLVSYGTGPQNYFTDVIASRATTFIRDTIGSAQPFFLYVATYAPHRPATPAPRSLGLFRDVVAPRTPSFNEADVTDKPLFIRNLPLLDRHEIAQLDQLHRRRLQSLQAVDDMVASFIVTLASLGQLDNTYIFFTSDNGYHLGQHRMPGGKQTAYEEDIRVPLIVRGPGVPARRTVDRLAVEIDLAPTFAELAGVPPPGFVDGRSLVPLLGLHVPSADQWRQCVLLEHHAGSFEPFESALEAAQLGNRNPHVPAYTGLRCREYTYVEYVTTEREFYDLSRDPYQLRNLQSTMPRALLDRLSARLADLLTCAGATCRGAEDAP